MAGPSKQKITMKCSICGGYVEWKGPLANLTHTECASCGATNCQEPEPEQEATPNEQQVKTPFETWWHDEGSGMAPLLETMARLASNKWRGSWSIHPNKMTR